MDYRFSPVGVVRSCFKERFGIPRQSGLAPAAQAVLELVPPWDREEAMRGLEDFSHLWLVYVFHTVAGKPWRPTVRPPRLGGNRRIGVFASRSPFRPNRLGLSAVRLDGFARHQGRLLMRLSGVDLLDGTPILDIKPYLPYADCIPDAAGGFAGDAPSAETRVVFAPPASEFLQGLDDAEKGSLRRLIVQVLALDPRPAYLDGRQRGREYGLRLHDYNIRWRVGESETTVTSIRPVSRP